MKEQTIPIKNNWIQDDPWLQNIKPNPIRTIPQATFTTSNKDCRSGVSCGFKMLKLVIEDDYPR